MPYGRRWVTKRTCMYSKWLLHSRVNWLLAIEIQYTLEFVCILAYSRCGPTRPLVRNYVLLVQTKLNRGKNYNSRIDAEECGVKTLIYHVDKRQAEPMKISMRGMGMGMLIGEEETKERFCRWTIQTGLIMRCHSGQWATGWWLHRWIANDGEFNFWCRWGVISHNC